MEITNFIAVNKENKLPFAKSLCFCYRLVGFLVDWFSRYTIDGTRENSFITSYSLNDKRLDYTCDTRVQFLLHLMSKILQCFLCSRMADLGIHATTVLFVSSVVSCDIRCIGTED